MLQLSQVCVDGKDDDVEERGEQQLRVAPAKRAERLFQGVLLKPVDVSDSAKVDKADPSVLEQKEIPGVRVGVVDAIDQNLLQVCGQKRVGERSAADAGSL